MPILSCVTVRGTPHCTWPVEWASCREPWLCLIGAITSTLRVVVSQRSTSGTPVVSHFTSLYCTLYMYMYMVCVLTCTVFVSFFLSGLVILSLLHVDCFKSALQTCLHCMVTVQCTFVSCAFILHLYLKLRVFSFCAITHCFS